MTLRLQGQSRYLSCYLHGAAHECRSSIRHNARHRHLRSGNTRSNKPQRQRTMRGHHRADGPAARCVVTSRCRNPRGPELCEDVCARTLSYPNECSAPVRFGAHYQLLVVCRQVSSGVKTTCELVRLAGVCRAQTACIQSTQAWRGSAVLAVVHGVTEPALMRLVVCRQPVGWHSRWPVKSHVCGNRPGLRSDEPDGACGRAQAPRCDLPLNGSSCLTAHVGLQAGYEHKDPRDPAW